MNEMSFADRIKRLREDKGLTKSEVAKKVGLSTTAYYFYELGRYRPSKIDIYESLARVFGCDIGYLTYDDERFADMEGNNTEEINIGEPGMTLGQKLKKLREEKGLTRNELAELAGVAHSTYGKYESDNNLPLHDETYDRLAEVLGCDVSYLKEGAEPAFHSLHDERKELGRRLRSAREEAGLGLKEFADKAGIPSSTLSNYETGYSRPKDVAVYDTFAEILGVSASIFKEFDPRFEENAGSVDLKSPEWETVKGVYSNDEMIGEEAGLLDEPEEVAEIFVDADKNTDDAVDSDENAAELPARTLDNEEPVGEQERIEGVLSTEQDGGQSLRPAELMHEVIQMISRLSALLAGNKLTRQEKDIIKASLDMAYREGTGE